MTVGERPSSPVPLPALPSRWAMRAWARSRDQLRRAVDRAEQEAGLRFRADRKALVAVLGPGSYGHFPSRKTGLRKPLLL